MPQLFRDRSTSPTTAVILQPTNKPPVKQVGFADAPVSRRLSNQELWRLFYFEAHARLCPKCLDPYQVHRRGGRLCKHGHLLAQDVARIMYSKDRGRDIFDAAVAPSRTPIRIDFPSDYGEVKSLLKAMERSLRHTAQRPIVSFDAPTPGAASRPAETLREDRKPRDSPRRAIARSRAANLPKDMPTNTPSAQRRPRQISTVQPESQPQLAYGDPQQPGPSSWHGVYAIPYQQPFMHPAILHALPQPHLHSPSQAPLLRTHYPSRSKPSTAPVDLPVRPAHHAASADVSGRPPTKYQNGTTRPVSYPPAIEKQSRRASLSFAPAYMTEFREPPKSKRRSGLF